MQSLGSSTSERRPFQAGARSFSVVVLQLVKSAGIFLNVFNFIVLVLVLGIHFFTIKGSQIVESGLVVLSSSLVACLPGSITDCLMRVLTWTT